MNTNETTAQENLSFGLLNHTFESKTGESIDALETLKRLQSGEYQISIRRATSDECMTVLTYFGEIKTATDQRVIAHCKMRNTDDFRRWFADYLHQ